MDKEREELVRTLDRTIGKLDRIRDTWLSRGGTEKELNAIIGQELLNLLRCGYAEDDPAKRAILLDLLLLCAQVGDSQ